MHENPITTMVELKDRLKELECYESHSFEAWYDTPIPHFDYESPRFMFETGDMDKLTSVLIWIEKGHHGSCA